MPRSAPPAMPPARSMRPKLGDAAAWAPRIKTGFDAPAPLGARRQGPDAGAGRRRLHRLRDRPRRGLHGQPERRQVRRSRRRRPPARSAAGGNDHRRRAGDPGRSRAAAAPAARTPVAAAAPATAETAAAAIPALYTQACSVCHAAGVAGAPKIGDKAAWAPRLAQGIDALVATVIKGKGAMPPRGGSTANDAEIKAVVDLDGRPGQVAGRPRHESSRPRAGFFLPALGRTAVRAGLLHPCGVSFVAVSGGARGALAVVPSTTRSAS